MYSRIKIKLGKTLCNNYREIIFVFLAFALMIIAAFFFIENILHGHLAVGILIFLGIALAISLSYIFLRICEEKTRLEEKNKFKSAFLANMSHEIRTPVNAITGMSELLLRGNLSDEARSYAREIRKAGTNLISIINDILDFSKIEAGRLEIVPVKYLLTSLINDSISIIRMRLPEKPIRFFTNIDGTIPNNLIGDESRLRQIIINLLTNAVKYTKKGHVGLSVVSHKREGSGILLKITVEDTGIGIKPEELSKLFSEFVQLDKEKNRGIEGTGLGLVITKRLCAAMGGDISVESEYGKGSIFTVIIPQQVDNEEPLASVENPRIKKVLVYERRTVYTESVCWSLDNMKIPYVLVQDDSSFADALKREEWFFIFSNYNLYDKIKPVMDQIALLGGKNPFLALMVEWGIEANIPGVYFLSLPIQSLSIANILNGKTDNESYFDNRDKEYMILFTIPEAKLLVVDDIATNLRVAEGLLAPYHAIVDTCLSGTEALELVKYSNYDLIFMDHMMPEMDGVETVAKLRAWEKEQQSAVPIIALTANAVSGMREMFLEKGFNDFIAKPIDVSELDWILNKWIPENKKVKAAEIRKEQKPLNKKDIPAIPGVDAVTGIAMTGGKIKDYYQVLFMFCRDAQERLLILKDMPEADTLPKFITQVHALKSASASIGAAEFSKKAAELEAAGNSGNLQLIGENLSGFSESLKKLIKDIRAALEKKI